MKGHAARVRPRDGVREELGRLQAQLAAVQSEQAQQRALLERVLAGDDPDDPSLTVQQIAKLTGRGEEAVRLWFTQRQLGHHDLISRRWRARRSEVIAFLVKNFGVERLPYALRPHLG
jgi:hypothetical protein